MSTEPRNKPTVYKGTVAKKSGDQTVRVTLEYQVKHPKYGKLLKRRTAAHVHDPNNEAGVGDVVEICKCRPISKSKNWRLVRVVEADSDN